MWITCNVIYSDKLNIENLSFPETMLDCRMKIAAIMIWHPEIQFLFIAYHLILKWEYTIIMRVNKILRWFCIEIFISNYWTRFAFYNNDNRTNISEYFVFVVTNKEEDAIAFHFIFHIQDSWRWSFSLFLLWRIFHIFEACNILHSWFQPSCHVHPCRDTFRGYSSHRLHYTGNVHSHILPKSNKM